jgi:hypothetical protein
MWEYLGVLIQLSISRTKTWRQGEPQTAPELKNITNSNYLSVMRILYKKDHMHLYLQTTIIQQKIN